MLEETANLKDTCISVTVQCHPDLEALKKLKKKKQQSQCVLTIILAEGFKAAFKKFSVLARNNACARFPPIFRIRHMSWQISLIR